MRVVRIEIEPVNDGFHIAAFDDAGMKYRYSADTRMMVLRRVAKLLGANPDNMVTFRELRRKGRSNGEADSGS